MMSVIGTSTNHMSESVASQGKFRQHYTLINRINDRWRLIGMDIAFMEVDGQPNIVSQKEDKPRLHT